MDTIKKYMLTALLCGIALIETNAQVLRFVKQPVGETACFVYFPAELGECSVSFSEDSLKITSNEVEVGEHKFGVILVEFEDKFTDMSPEQLSDLLVAYMDYLKTNFAITQAAGYGKGHTMESHQSAQGILDYWYTDEGLQYAVKGWIDQKLLCVLYIVGEQELNFNYQQMYLNGFRFGM